MLYAKPILSTDRQIKLFQRRCFFHLNTPSLLTSLVEEGINLSCLSKFQWEYMNGSWYEMRKSVKERWEERSARDLVHVREVQISTHATTRREDPRFFAFPLMFQPLLNLEVVNGVSIDHFISDQEKLMACESCPTFYIPARTYPVQSLLFVALAHAWSLWSRTSAKERRNVLLSREVSPLGCRVGYVEKEAIRTILWRERMRGESPMQEFHLWDPTAEATLPKFKFFVLF